MYLAAVTQASQAALSSAPALRLRFPALDITGGFWAYVPLALIIISSAAWLLERLSPRRMSHAEYQSAAALAKTVTDATDKLLARSPKPPDPHAPKEFVPDSFVRRYLDMINSHRTDLQKEAFLRPHLNQWMKISAQLEQSGKSGDAIRVSMRDPSWKGPSAIFSITCHLVWATHLAHIEPGEPVTFNVQIVDTGYGVELMNGELV